jgi:hypothetical protein
VQQWKWTNTYIVIWEHTTICVFSYYETTYRSMWSSYFYIFVLILPYVSPNVSSYYYIWCVLILLYMCHTTIHVCSYYNFVCSHTTICVSSYYDRCVLILLYMCSHTVKRERFLQEVSNQITGVQKRLCLKRQFVYRESNILLVSALGKATSY